MSDKQIEKYIKRTFELAAKGRGWVSPNPLVGAILVKNNKIIGEGYHKRIGNSHAEIIAIESATEPVQGSTLYCNLEPCCHHNKKTPPCAQRIIKEGIKRVVISNRDINPMVNGKGLELMRKEGIEVSEGILEENGLYLNRFYFKYMNKKTPYVTVKIAQSINGLIYSEQANERWISNEKSRKLVHQWRTEYDAVLIGAGTVKTDDPELTVRLVKGRNPKRIILDGNLNLDPDYRIFNLADSYNTIIYTTVKGNNNIIKKFEQKGVQVIIIESNTSKINLHALMQEIGKLNITSLLVEGGSQIFTQFLEKSIGDELKIFLSPKLLTDGINAFNSKSKIQSKLHLSKIKQLGNDVLFTYHL